MKKTCNICLMDDSDPFIQFDETGRCNYCKRAERLLEKGYFPDKSGEEKLQVIFNKIKKTEIAKKYDCLVGVSGGLDSTYVLYLAYMYGLRALAVHIDDGLDSDEAKSNIRKIIEKTNFDLITIVPELEEYKKLTLSMFRAGVPNLAIVQDNILQKSLHDIAKEYDFKYFLSGGNLAHESILQSIQDNNIYDSRHIKDIYKKFGTSKIHNTKLYNPLSQFIDSKILKRINYVRPLNYINYNLDSSLHILKDFCDYRYYGGKHHESILTRFLQMWWLPNFFNFDKRKSHYSSLIVSNQMKRVDALRIISENKYMDSDLFLADKKCLASYFDLSDQEFENLLNRPKHNHSNFSTSNFLKLMKLLKRLKEKLR